MDGDPLLMTPISMVNLKLLSIVKNSRVQSFTSGFMHSPEISQGAKETPPQTKSKSSKTNRISKSYSQVVSEILDQVLDFWIMELSFK